MAISLFNVSSRNIDVKKNKRPSKDYLQQRIVKSLTMKCLQEKQGWKKESQHIVNNHKEISALKKKCKRACSYSSFFYLITRIQSKDVTRKEKRNSIAICSFNIQTESSYAFQNSSKLQTNDGDKLVQNVLCFHK